MEIGLAIPQNVKDRVNIGPRNSIRRYAAAAAKLLQSCPTLCDPIDSSPPSSPVPGILQARTLEWVAISFSNAWKWKWKVKVKLLSHVWLLATPWTAAYQAPLSMGFSRQEYWSGLPLHSPIHRYTYERNEMYVHPKNAHNCSSSIICNSQNVKNPSVHQLMNE